MYVLSLMLSVVVDPNALNVVMCEGAFRLESFVSVSCLKHVFFMEMTLCSTILYYIS